MIALLAADIVPAPAVHPNAIDHAVALVACLGILALACWLLRWIKQGCGE